MSIRGSASFILSKKLKETKLLFKTWNRESFGRLEFNKNQALSQLRAWDSMEEERELTLVEVEAKEAKDSYKMWETLEEIH